MIAMKDIRVLCLSFRTPPEVRPQAILIGKMMPEWIRQGLKPVIVNYANGGVWDIDAPVHSLPRYSFLSNLSRLPFVGDAAERIYYEDMFRRTRKVIESHRINLVYSFAKPQQSNYLAAMIRDRLGIPCIAHYSDPWYERALATATPAAASLVLSQERFTISTCDRVVFVSERLRDLVMKKFPTEWFAKTAVIPHSFAPTDYPADDSEDHEKFTISHLGVFYRNGRDPRTLFGAVAQLIERRPELAKRIDVELIGSVSKYSEITAEELDAMIEEYGLADSVRLIPTVSFRESLRYMKRSDCLMAIDLDVPKSPYTPSKVFDYVGSGRPIAGIMREDNPTAVFIRNAGYPTFRHGESEELSRCFEDLVDGRRSFSPNATFINQFTVNRTTESLINLFKEVCH